MVRFPSVNPWPSVPSESLISLLGMFVTDARIFSPGDWAAHRGDVRVGSPVETADFSSHLAQQKLA